MISIFAGCLPNHDRAHSQTVPICESSGTDPWKGFTPRTSKRTCVDTIKKTYLKSSFHHTGTTQFDLRCQKIPPEPPRVRSSKTSNSNHSPTKFNPVVSPQNGTGLSITGPSPGFNPTINPSSLLSCRA